MDTNAVQVELDATDPTRLNSLGVLNAGIATMTST
jgi:hypothetical protein